MQYGYKPQIEARFHTRKGLQFSTGEILTYSSNRTMDNPAASAQFMLKGLSPKNPSHATLRNQKWEDLLGLYDQCQVRLRDAKGAPWIDINGLITDISIQEAESDGKPVESTSITLTGLGNTLQSTSLFFHPHIAGRSNISGIGWLNRAEGKPPAGRPDQVLRQIYNVFINEDYNFKLPDGRKLYEAISLSTTEIRDGLALLALNALGQEENLWNVMKRFADQPWNSMWVDVPQKRSADQLWSAMWADGAQSLLHGTDRRHKGQVSDFHETVYFEPTPFDFKQWDKLAQKGSDRFFEVLDSERMGSGFSLKRSSEGISTMFWCPGKGVTSGFDQMSQVYENSGGQVPIYFKGGIERLGLRRMEQGTEYVQYFNESHEQKGVISAAERHDMKTRYPERTDLLLKRTMQLAQWYGWEEGFWKGTIETRGRVGWSVENGARVGSVLRRKSNGMEFFITGISQNWSHPGPFTTTFSVERGHIPSQYRAWWIDRVKELSAGRGMALEIAKDLLGDYGLDSFF